MKVKKGDWIKYIGPSGGDRLGKVVYIDYSQYYPILVRGIDSGCHVIKESEVLEILPEENTVIVDTAPQTPQEWESRYMNNAPAPAIGDKYKAGPAPAPAKDAQVGGSHYRELKIQPIEYILANGLGYCEGNVVKYVSRWRAKGGLEDLRKAKQYLDFLIEQESK